MIIGHLSPSIMLDNICVIAELPTLGADAAILLLCSEHEVTRR
jgi:hypothetical protein